MIYSGFYNRVNACVPDGRATSQRYYRHCTSSKQTCALCAFCVIQRFLRKKALFAHLQCLRVIMNVEGLLAHVPKWPNDYP